MPVTVITDMRRISGSCLNRINKHADSRIELNWIVGLNQSEIQLNPTTKTDNKFGMYYCLVAIDFKLVNTDCEGM